MSYHPAPIVTNSQYVGHGIDHLPEPQLHAIAEALGFKHRDQLSGLDKAERLGKVQGSINHLAPEGHVEAMMERSPDKYRNFAMALGYNDPTNLSHVGRIEQAAAVQKRVQELSL